MSFNDLNAAESERLALLLEELGEAQQAIGKILRHGYDSCHPDRLGGPDNRQALERELGDVFAAIFLLTDAKDLRFTTIQMHKSTKLGNVGQYLHHQDKTP